jgi:hypothetical protein
MPEGSYRERTIANVKDADALVWFGQPYSPGGKLTLGEARRKGISHYVSIYDSTPPALAAWLEDHVLFLGETVKLLVAGNRESIFQGIGRQVQTFLAVTLDLLGDKVDRLPLVNV